MNLVFSVFPSRPTSLLVSSRTSLFSFVIFVFLLDIRGCIQKFPDWPPGARTANGTALCHQVYSCIAVL
jgi:hypothetical protein